MLRYGSAGTASTTTTTQDQPENSSRRGIRRLRLTLHPGQDGHKEPERQTSVPSDTDKLVNGAWKKKNGLIQRERPAAREPPVQAVAGANGLPETVPLQHGPKVYGVVQRTGAGRQQEVMAREWPVNHLQDEMRYIREVRDSLEKVRERMYGQFGGMQQSMQKLSQEIRAANHQRRSLESEVRIRTESMEHFDQMNSSLISANLDLQKSLLQNCRDRVDTKEELKSLRNSREQTEEKLKEKERELAAAQAENQTLRLQVECSQEASNRALQEVTSQLERQFEEKLSEEQRRHREEVESLQTQIDEYVRRLEETETNLKLAHSKITERDERIQEVERLLDCMGQEKTQLQKKLQEYEQRLRLIELTDQTDATIARRSKQLQEETSNLRERIKHLNDMVFCQQRKVKAMIEEVESLRAQVANKDAFISELLDRIAIVECENRPRDVVHTREVGVSCHLLPRDEAHRSDTDSTVQSEPSQSRPVRYQYQSLTSPTQPKTFKSDPPSSRLESSLLRYSPVEYSRFLQSSSSHSWETQTSPRRSESDSVTPVHHSTDASAPMPTVETDSFSEESSPALSPPPVRLRPLQIYTPFMKLMEITANINIE